VTAGRVFDGLFAATFILSAAVQYNDPDPIRWIVIYLAATFAAAAPPGSRIGFFLAAVSGIAATIWALMVLPEAAAVTSMGDVVASMSPDRPETEAAREFGGLMLIVVWSVIRVLRGP